VERKRNPSSRRRRPTTPIGEYPTDSRGFAIAPSEVDDRFFDLDFDGVEEWNNHHLNFYARSFGSLAISHTFRDLESQQVPMVKWRHSLLHILYTGMNLPPLTNMMEEIEMQKVLGNKRKIYTIYEKKYELLDIDNDVWVALNREYNEVSK
jgi:hypothetical protein